MGIAVANQVLHTSEKALILLISSAMEIRQSQAGRAYNVRETVIE